jgi:D-sedoheptulose 7-phosphate isomerase
VIAAIRGRSHIAALMPALEALEDELQRLERWAAGLAETFARGGRLLVAGNGGSAAEAQHLTAELVGRYEADRPPCSALALHAETSSLTAIANDFGAREAFARQVRAHGRPGDVLLAISTSGESENVVAAARAAVSGGLATWALTGPAPNALGRVCDDALAVEASLASTVQEVHLVALHVLCELIDCLLTEDAA